MRILTAFLTIILAAVAAWPTIAAPQGVTTPTPGRTPYAVLFTDGTWATMTPVSPTAPPTNTPRPTATPQPSASPTPTATPAAVCRALTLVNLNVRADHTTDAARLGTLPADTTVEVSALHVVYAEGDPLRTEWGRITYQDEVAWIALWYRGGEFGRLDDTPACWELPIEYERDPLPVRAGFHVLMGQGGSAVIPYAGQIGTLKCLDGVWDICRAVKAASPDTFIVCRSLTVGGELRGGPLGAEWFTPSIYAAKLWPHLPPPGEGLCDAIEVVNEWGPLYGYDVFAQWSIDMAQLVEARFGVPMLAFSFGPGNPDFGDWLELVPYLEWVAANPLPDGRFHGIAWHGSAHATWERADSPWINEAYITGAGRYELVADYLLREAGFDLCAWPGLTAVTEIGVTDGYSGNWNATYSCAEKADAFQATRAALDAADVAMFHWWNVGSIAGWSSDAECVGQMLQ